MTRPTVLLREGPCLVYAGTSSDVLLSTVLVLLTEVEQTTEKRTPSGQVVQRWATPTHRVRCYQDSKPTPTLLLDQPVRSFDLQQQMLPRDRTPYITLTDGRVLRVEEQGGGCACGAGQMLRGWTPDD